MARAVTPLKIAVVSSGRQQKDIATEAGISESHLSRVVNGLHCDDETKRAIAAALGSSVVALWPGQHGAQHEGASDGSDADRRSAA